MKVTALTNVKHKGKIYKAGSKLDVAKAIAEDLLLLGAIDPLDGGVDDDPADSTDDDGSDGKAADSK